MSRIASLKGKAGFSQVYRKGRVFNTGLFRLYILKRDDDSARIGIAVTRRACKAVKRNLIRRRIKNIVSSASPELTAGKDMIFYVNTDVSGVAFSELKAEILLWLKT